MAVNQIPPRGVEPLEANRQTSDNSALTENTNPVFATSLAKIVQACSELAESEYPELEQIITAWPELPEDVKTTIIELVKDGDKRAE